MHPPKNERRVSKVKKLQTKKHLRILSMIMALLVCVGLFMPVNAAAANNLPTNPENATVKISITNAEDTDCQLKNLTAAEKQAVKVTIKIQETGATYTRTLKQLLDGNLNITLGKFSYGKDYHATITVDSSALQNYNLILGGEVYTDSGFYFTTMPDGEMASDSACHSITYSNFVGNSVELWNTSKITLQARLVKVSKPIMKVSVRFPVYNAIKFENTPWDYQLNSYIAVYELQGNTYKQIWRGSLHDLQENGLTSFVLKAGAKYKVVKTFKPISGYTVSYAPYWLDRGNGTSSHTAPAGFNNAVFYFTAQANHIYTFDTIATIMKNK